MNILDYIRSKVRVTLSEDSIKAILLDRPVDGIVIDENSDAASLDFKTRELLLADAYMVVATSPDSWGGSTEQHGGFTLRLGSEGINQDKYIRMATDIYLKYNDDRLILGSDLSWIDNDY